MRSRLAVLSLTMFLVALHSPAQTFRGYPLQPNAGLWSITAGPDGAVWFTELSAIGRISPAGNPTEFPLQGPAFPFDIVAGPDGALWFTEYNADKIGRITTSGSLTEFRVPTSASGLQGIAVGPDGNLWFVEAEGNKVGRITTAGSITEFPLPSGYDTPMFIAAGPDHNLWFTSHKAIFRLTTSGTFTAFPLVPNVSCWAITAGPDGNLWFINGNGVGRVSVDGTITQVVNASNYGGVVKIAFDGAGNLYFALPNVDQIVRMTPEGRIMRIKTPSPNSEPRAVTVGPDGNIWFTEASTDTIRALDMPLRRVLPVVGSTAGALGSMFRTSVQLHNCSTSEIAGSIVFHASGAAGSDGDPSLSYSLAAGETKNIADLLPAMSRAGLGSGDVFESRGDFPLIVARVFNDSGDKGTSGFTEDLLPGSNALEAGSEFDVLVPADLNRFRLNVGVRSLSQGASVTITQINASGTVVRTLTKTYSPTFFEQVDAAKFAGGAVSANDSIRVHVDAGSLFVYGATTDNTTQDPSMQISRN